MCERQKQEHMAVDEVPLTDTKLWCILKVSDRTGQLIFVPEGQTVLIISSSTPPDREKEREMIKACPDLLLPYINTWLLSVTLSCSITPLQQVPLGHKQHTHTHHSFSPSTPSVCKKTQETNSLVLYSLTQPLQTLIYTIRKRKRNCMSSSFSRSAFSFLEINTYYRAN